MAVAGALGKYPRPRTDGPVRQLPFRPARIVQAGRARARSLLASVVLLCGIVACGDQRPAAGGGTVDTTRTIDTVPLSPESAATAGIRDTIRRAPPDTGGR